MKLYSTNDRNNVVKLKEAVLQAMPIDKGLYLPISIPKLPRSFFESLEGSTLNHIAKEVCNHLFDNYISEKDVETIIDKAFDFNAPLMGLGNNMYSLELFHGPTLAFKDFGARFMAQLMSYFNRNDNSKITILVATSGDTGGAVASGFYNTEGIEVVILYPSGKVSQLQEKQLTTWGANISAVEVQGTFDDCQTLVKTAFLDDDLNGKLNLSSANSINIARLIPQSFYYFEAIGQLSNHENIVIAIPSGNFGNLTAGLMAQKMGLNVKHFIAATNRNDVVPNYLKTGEFIPKSSVSTISNAMDVGNPSNFPRLLDIQGSTWNIIKENINGYSLDDHTTKQAMLHANANYGYVCDPHGAIAYQAIYDLIGKKKDIQGIFLETAHPAKFLDVVEQTLDRKIEIPESLIAFKNKQKEALLMKNSFEAFKSYLMNR